MRHNGRDEKGTGARATEGWRDARRCARVCERARQCEDGHEGWTGKQGGRVRGEVTRGGREARVGETARGRRARGRAIGVAGWVKRCDMFAARSSGVGKAA